MRNPEASYISKLDRPNDDEILNRSMLAEELVVDTINSALPGFSARLSTESEDSGSAQDLSIRQMIDAVAYLNGKPVMGLQVTTADSRNVRQQKFLEMMNKPFIRLHEMSNSETAIPRVLVYLKKEIATAYAENSELARSPETIHQVIDGILKSLDFDLSKTKNPKEIRAINELKNILIEQERKQLH